MGDPAVALSIGAYRLPCANPLSGTERRGGGPESRSSALRPGPRSAWSSAGRASPKPCWCYSDEWQRWELSMIQFGTMVAAILVMSVVGATMNAKMGDADLPRAGGRWGARRLSRVWERLTPRQIVSLCSRA